MKKKNQKKLQQKMNDDELLSKKKQLTDNHSIIKTVEDCIKKHKIYTVIELSMALNISPKRIQATFSSTKSLNSKLSNGEVEFILSRFRTSRLADIQFLPQGRIIKKLVREKKKTFVNVISTPMQD